MTQVYKILTEKCDSLISPKFPLLSASVTRGNSFKIINRRCHYDLRKFSFFVIELPIYTRHSAGNFGVSEVQRCCTGTSVPLKLTDSS